MRVIPVIDLMGGHVVRGVAGERSRYRPVVSLLAQDAAPRSVAQAFAQRLGAREVYVADLDAISDSAICDVLSVDGQYKAEIARALRYSLVDISLASARFLVVAAS